MKRIYLHVFSTIILMLFITSSNCFSEQTLDPSVNLNKTACLMAEINGKI